MVVVLVLFLMMLVLPDFGPSLGLDDGGSSVVFLDGFLRLVLPDFGSSLGLRWIWRGLVGLNVVFA